MIPLVCWITIYQIFFSKTDDLHNMLSIVIVIGFIVLYLWLMYTTALLIFRNYQAIETNEELTRSEVLKKLFSLIGVYILREIGVRIFLIFLIIPGIIFGNYWTFTAESLLIGDATGLDAFGKSYDRVENQWWNVFLENILLSIVGGVIAFGFLMLVSLILGFLRAAIPHENIADLIAIVVASLFFFIYSVFFQTARFFLYLKFEPISLEDKTN